MQNFVTKEDKLLLKEAGLASTCIGQGLTILRKANFVNDWNYYQSFLLLTIGIERLLKIIIITKFRVDNNGLFPTDNYLKNLGHDIKKLIKTVNDFEIDKDEIEIIDDEIQLDIIDFLTRFAKATRYYNLDVLSGNEKQTDPLIEWKRIQNKIKEKKGLISKPPPKGFTEFVNSFSMFAMTDEEGNFIDSAEEFYKDSSILNKLQGHSIYNVWRIIQILADKLRYFEYKHNLFPTLREFFPYFSKDWDKDINVMTWEDWNYLK